MNKKNLAVTEITTAPSPATTGTSLVVQHGTRLPVVPFFATVQPAGQLPTPDNAEIVEVTARSTNTLTITRGQRGSTPKSIAAGWLLLNGIYTEDLDDKVDGTVRLTVSNTAPAAPDTGDVWFDTNETEDYLGYNTPVTKQVPSGAIDGSNVTYVTSSPYIANSLEVYINGLRQGIAHVTESNPLNGTFTVDIAPQTGDTLEVSYLKVVTTSGNASTLGGNPAPTGLIVGTTDAQTLTNKSIDAHNNTIRNISSFELEPQEGWIAASLVNGWVNFAAGWEDAAYMKDHMGFVHLRGMVKSGTVGAVTFNIPVGYRPLANMVFPAISNNAFGQIRVYPDGNVYMWAGSNLWFNMTGITFRAEQ